MHIYDCECRSVLTTRVIHNFYVIIIHIAANYLPIWVLTWHIGGNLNMIYCIHQSYTNGSAIGGELEWGKRFTMCLSKTMMSAKLGLSFVFIEFIIGLNLKHQYFF